MQKTKFKAAVKGFSIEVDYDNTDHNKLNDFKKTK